MRKTVEQELQNFLIVGRERGKSHMQLQEKKALSGVDQKDVRREAANHGAVSREAYVGDRAEEGAHGPYGSNIRETTLEASRGGNVGSTDVFSGSGSEPGGTLMSRGG